MIISVLVFFNDTATTEIYTYVHTLSLHDALPIFLSNDRQKFESRQHNDLHGFAGARLARDLAHVACKARSCRSAPMACAQAAQAAFRSFLDVGNDQLEFRHAPPDRSAVATVAAPARLRQSTVGPRRRPAL